MKVKHRVDHLKEKIQSLQEQRSRTVPMLGIDVYSEEEQAEMSAQIAAADAELEAIYSEHPYYR